MRSRATTIPPGKYCRSELSGILYIAKLRNSHFGRSQISLFFSNAIFFAFGAMQFNFYRITEMPPFISDPYLAHTIEEKVMEQWVSGLNYFSTISLYVNLLFSFLQEFFVGV